MKGLVERRRTSALIGARYYTLARHRDTRMKEAITRHLPESGRFLDAGCGRKGTLAAIFRDRCSLAVAMDLERPAPDAGGVPGVVSDLHALGLASSAFDVAALRSVTEHLPRPVEAFVEIARVLRPGGAAVILCPNKWFYSSMVGRLLPGPAVSRLLRLIFGMNVYDNFPTYYKANTRRAVRRLAARAGLEVELALPCEHPPDYLKLSPFLFHLGVYYDRLTARWRPLQWLAVSYLFVLRKPGVAERAAPARAAEEHGAAAEAAQRAGAP